jgi:DNA modification methylase
MIPARIALALQADGWVIRSKIIWRKPNPMPESVRDRPTSAYEEIFLLTRGARYFYDADAIKNPPSEALLRQVADGYDGRSRKRYAMNGAQDASATKSRIIAKAREKIDKQRGHGRRHAGFNDRWDRLTKSEQTALGSNARNVWIDAEEDIWSIAAQPTRDAHFATFPLNLVERCLKAGCPPNGSVLDPFAGSGSTGLAARRLGMSATLIELNPDYVEIMRRRLAREAGAADVLL